MSTLTEQRQSAGAKLIRRVAVDFVGVSKGHGVDTVLLDKLIPNTLKPALQVALYLTPAGIKPLIDRLKDSPDEDIAEIIDSVDTPEHGDIPELVQELTVLGDKHAKKEALISGIEDLESGEYSREQQCIDRVGRVIVETGVENTIYNNVDTGAEDMDSIIEVFKEGDRSNHPKTGTIYDQWMVLGPGEMGGILTPPGVGKTTSMVDVSVGYAEHNEGVVIFFSEEMATATILRKHVSRMTGKHRVDEDTLMNEFLTATMRIKGDIVIESHDSGTSTVGFLKYRAEKLAKGRKIIAIIVDYLGLLKTEGNSRYDGMSSNVVNMRGQLAGYFKCPCWTGAQPQRNPSRDVQKAVSITNFKPPVLGMADVADCWAIPHVLDFLASINQTDEEKDNTPPKARIHCAKARIPEEDKIKTPTFNCGIDYALCKVM